MRSLSKVIKSGRVLLDDKPVIMRLSDEFTKAGETVRVEDILEENAQKSAEISLKRALERSKEITDRANVEANLAYNEAFKEGGRRGYEEGLRNGAGDGEKKSAETICAAAGDLISRLTALDMKRYSSMARERAACIDFAFKLADNILNCAINRDAAEYKTLLAGFMKPRTKNVTLSADGKKYSFESLHPDDVLDCAKGISDISFSVEESMKDEAEPVDMPVPCGVTIYENTDADSESEYVPEPEAAAEPEALAKPEKTVGNRIVSEEAKSGGSGCEEQSAAQNDKENGGAVDIPADTSGAQAGEDGLHEDEKHEDEKPETGGQRQDGTWNSIESEKFVFVRPVSKNIPKAKTDFHSGKTEYEFEDLLSAGAEVIKPALKKADIKDISAALSDAGDEVTAVFMQAMSAKLREKVAEAIKYLGPVPPNERDEARQRITELACEIERKKGE